MPTSDIASGKSNRIEKEQDMELKNAAAVCLISLFSATLVVLIARALDSQAASRLEPQLASIVEELQAIRKQGGIPTAAGADPRS